MRTQTSHRPVFVLRSGTTWADPFELYAQLRSESPVHHVDDGDYWVLTRHADVIAAASDPATFSSSDGLTVAYGELEAIGMADNPPMVMTDPPVHTQFRRLVSRGFTPRQVTTLEPQVRDFVRERLDRIDGSGSAPADIVGELFKPLPSMVVAHYLGVPESDRSQFDGWTDAIVGAATGNKDTEDQAGAATMDMLGYFTGLIEHRREHPADDTVSHLVAAGLADDPPGLLSILAFTFTMVAGGNDTTTGMLGGSVDLLHRNPDQRARLIDDETLIPDAVNELLRLTSPVQNLARTTTREVTLPDADVGRTVTLPAGRKVLLCYAAANRDPAAYGPDAEDLDIDRRPRNILTFSHGNHHCLGAAAARMQARIALTELLRRYPSFAVDSDGIRWAAGNYVRRPTFVPFYPAGR